MYSKKTCKEIIMELFIVLIVISIVAVWWFYQKTSKDNTDVKEIEQAPYKVEQESAQPSPVEVAPLAEPAKLATVSAPQPIIETVSSAETIPVLTDEVNTVVAKEKNPRKKPAKKSIKTVKTRSKKQI